MQDVEEEHRQRLRGAGRDDVDAAAESRGGDLELVRPPVGAQRDGFAVGHQRGDRQRQRGLDHLGQPGRDVVEAAGEDRDRRRRRGGSAPARRRASPRRRPGRPAGPAHRRRRWRSARASARPAGRPAAGTAASASAPPRQRRGGNGRQRAAEHRGAPHVGGREAGRLCHRVGHHAEQRALPQFTAEQAAQEGLLGLGGGAEQVAPAASARRACDPAPDVVLISVNAASTARHRRASSPSAGSGSERNDAQPTPI